MVFGWLLLLLGLISDHIVHNLLLVLRGSLLWGFFFGLSWLLSLRGLYWLLNLLHSIGFSEILLFVNFLIVSYLFLIHFLLKTTFFLFLGFALFSISNAFLTFGLPLGTLLLSFFPFFLLFAPHLFLFGDTFALLSFILARLGSVPFVVGKSLELLIGLVLGEVSHDLGVIEVFLNANLLNLFVLNIHNLVIQDSRKNTISLTPSTLIF